VNAILGLAQNEANITEAETSKELSKETIRQGRILMGFTIITIVFVSMDRIISTTPANYTSD